MKFCPYCGADLLKEDAAFCVECGKQLSSAEQAPVADAPASPEKQKPAKNKAKQKKEKPPKKKKEKKKKSKEPIPEIVGLRYRRKPRPRLECGRQDLSCPFYGLQDSAGSSEDQRQRTPQTQPQGTGQRPQCLSGSPQLRCTSPDS